MRFPEYWQHPELGSRGIKDPLSYANWIAAFKVFFGDPLTDSELEVARQCTGREVFSPDGYSEGWFIVGRRGGKSFMISCAAVYLAFFVGYTPFLAPGELAVIPIIAADRAQAQVCLRYIKGLITGNLILEQYVDDSLKESITLGAQRVRIEVHSASFKTVRGRSFPVVILDEAAYFPTGESANPDTEIVTSVRPAMATFPNAKLFVASSPYARRGMLFEVHRDHFGVDDSNILVWQAGTTVMNPTIDAAFIQREREKDPQAARAEFDALFREDISSAFDPEAVRNAAVLPGVLGPAGNTRYHAFVDVSAGRSDAYTICVAHQDSASNKVVIDLLQAWDAPFDPIVVTAEVC